MNINIFIGLDKKNSAFIIKPTFLFSNFIVLLQRHAASDNTLGGFVGSAKVCGAVVRFVIIA